MKDLATTIREAVEPDVWTGAGTSLVIDGESLVVRADPGALDRIRWVLAEMRRFR